MKTQMKTTYQTIENVLAKNFHLAQQYITPEKYLRSGLGLSSLEFVELIVMVENTFKIDLADQEIEKAKTLNDLIVCIDRQLVVKYPNLYEA
jgi:acyl carrier protein